jgi:hypothetical protein
MDELNEGIERNKSKGKLEKIYACLHLGRLVKNSIK